VKILGLIATSPVRGCGPAPVYTRAGGGASSKVDDLTIAALTDGGRRETLTAQQAAA